MRYNSMNELMNTLVKRYNLSQASPQSTVASQQAKPVSRSPQNVESRKEIKMLRENLEKTTQENLAMKTKLDSQATQLKQKDEEMSSLSKKWQKGQKVWEQKLSQKSERIKALQSHSEAMQKELLSIKDLLRQQEALIIQLSSTAHDETD